MNRLPGGSGRSLLPALALALATAGAAGAEVTRLVEPDGTVHLTNAPDDPRYRRMGAGPAEGRVAPGAGEAGEQGARAQGSTATADRAGEPRDPRALPYRAEIAQAADRHGVPAGLVSAIIRAESDFDPRAVSRRGAQGLMQLMPSTAAALGLRNPFDPRENIEAGVRHLRGLIERFGSDLSLVLAAYNAGEQAIALHRGMPPYAETRGYVRRVLSLFGESGGHPAAPSRAGTSPATTPRAAPPGR